MDVFIPDIYSQSIYTINYRKLKKNGIKCLLFDLDNTIVSYKDNIPDKKLKEFFHHLEDDFKVIIFSNSRKNRLRPFKEQLNVDTAFSCRKPFKKKYKKILDIYKFKETQIACIGDQLITDIWGANRMNFTSILVNRIGKKEPIWTKTNRFFEGFILKKLAKKHILVKGEYYD